MARTFYIVADRERGIYVGKSPSIRGAKKIAAMRGWKNEEGQLCYGAVWKDQDVQYSEITRQAEILPGAEPVAVRGYNGNAWGWSDTGTNAAYRDQNGARKERHDSATKRYRDKFIKATVFLPPEVDAALREMDPGSRQGYILELIKEDLRERGYLQQ